jgi:hypothetical protein
MITRRKLFMDLLKIGLSLWQAYFIPTTNPIRSMHTQSAALLLKNNTIKMSEHIATTIIVRFKINVGVIV